MIWFSYRVPSRNWKVLFSFILWSACELFGSCQCAFNSPVRCSLMHELSVSTSREIFDRWSLWVGTLILFLILRIQDSNFELLFIIVLCRFWKAFSSSAASQIQWWVHSRNLQKVHLFFRDFSEDKICWILDTIGCSGQYFGCALLPWSAVTLTIGFIYKLGVNGHWPYLSGTTIGQCCHGLMLDHLKPIPNLEIWRKACLFTNCNWADVCVAGVIGETASVRWNQGKTSVLNWWQLEGKKGGASHHARCGEYKFWIVQIGSYSFYKMFKISLGKVIYMRLK